VSPNAVEIAAILTPQIRASRKETEEKRQLPEDVLRSLVDSQLFRLAVPRELGGLELDPLTALDVYEELAKSEASAGWLVWNSSLPCLFGRFLSDSARSDVLGDQAHKYASSTRPTGKAVRQNGEYRVSGRWSLVSGCMHADWLGLMCLVEHDGEIEMLEEGAPHMRMAYVPAGSFDIIDTWNVGGLRGTGSHDIVVEDVAVPAERTFTPMDPSRLDRPIGRMPIACTMAAGHAAICLGIAATALEEVVRIGRSKVTVDPVPRLPDRASSQFLVAETSTKIAALRAELRASLGELWADAEAGADTRLESLADAWSAAVTTGRSCRDMVTAMYDVAGSPALYVDCVLERCHRDIHAAMQHVIAQRFWVEEAGRVRFGMDPTNPLFAV
jgi:alkylation response protein AidB-like acyl-CoA dehydrogenase